MIGRRGERGSGLSVLAARHDDDDDDSIYQIFLCNINNLYTALWFQITNNNS